MRARWMALHESLVRSITTLKADQQFKTAGKIEKVLERFDAADTLVAYLTTKGGDLDEKDRIYGALVRAVQSRSDWRDLATALIWLGLWPGLDAIYGHRLRDFVGRPDELVTEISFIFTTMVERIDLSGVNRLASTLVRNVERDVREGLKRHWADDARAIDVNDSERAECDPHLQTKPTIDNRGLPVSATDLPALRDWLTRVARVDADLVIGAVLYGFDQHEMADRLGITHEAARKRFQKAIERLRDLLEPSR